MPNFLSQRFSLGAVIALGAEGWLESCGNKTNGQESIVGVFIRSCSLFFSTCSLSDEGLLGLAPG